ncbi:hypothetical protein ILFOPFJJ_06018 [Ensifer psoraleae]|nr:hypothetical protein [Sinorhizobium psoraleae]
MRTTVTAGSEPCCVVRGGKSTTSAFYASCVKTICCACARDPLFLTTNSRHGWQVVPNLARGMILNGVNQLWVADITFLHLAEEFAFLAVVLDAFSRRVVGWALDTHLRASLAIEALEMAITDRQPAPGSLVHHSDRGVQGRFNRSSQHLERGGCYEVQKSELSHSFAPSTDPAGTLEVTVRASERRWPCEDVEDRLPDGRHARLWWRTRESFFSVPRP